MRASLLKCLSRMSFLPCRLVLGFSKMLRRRSSRCVALVCAIDDFDDIEPNAAHIAAFNPELILRLLDVVEAAQGINNGDVSKYDEYWRDLEAAIKALGG